MRLLGYFVPDRRVADDAGLREVGTRQERRENGGDAEKRERAARSQEDAEYYARYLEQAIAWLDKNGNFARPSDKTATLEAFRAGQRVYRRRAEEAAQRKIASLRLP